MSKQKFLFEEIDSFKSSNKISQLPQVIVSCLSPRINLREYQEHAILNFINYFENPELRKNKQIFNMFHMATGSGKTVIMAALILYLYSKGYKKFLFYVNSTNVLEKTIDNFTNPNTSKYLFNDEIYNLGTKVTIKSVETFSDQELDGTIEIVFKTIQGLHTSLSVPKENSITFEDFENNKIVFISDESHHLNSSTQDKTNSKNEKTWEASIMKAYSKNRDNILLEFTATCDLKNKEIREKYLDKIVYDYPLVKFRESGYTKDFQNFALDTDIWKRVLISLVMSEYRRMLFADLKLNIKPVILFKSRIIKESEEFYKDFFNWIDTIDSKELLKLKGMGVRILDDAIDYFEKIDPTLESLEHSIKDSFTVERSVLLNSSSESSSNSSKSKDIELPKKLQLVNTLEDKDNHIRCIFVVDMLNEGWDVLNLFDIVRLYDTSNTKSTIREAQLIGRGARYCPFVFDDPEQKYKRKFDYDLDNRYRLLETMFFYSEANSIYINELKSELVRRGIEDAQQITLEYTLKEKFKQSDFYNNSYIYSNKREPKSRDHVTAIESRMQFKRYRFNTHSGSGVVSNLFSEEHSNLSNNSKVNSQKITSIKLKDLNLNVLLGASEFFDELRFDVLQSKYPSLTSKKEFFTSEKFIGENTVEITHYNNEVSGLELFNAVKYVLSQVATHITSLKPEYIGTKEFIPRKFKDVVKDKRIHISHIKDNGGYGASQNLTSNQSLCLNIESENWYVFNDNFGTSEEKLFIRFFKSTMVPELEKRRLEYYLVRNERIPELAIYAFDDGERFEPDFLLFIKKKVNDESLIYQGYIEPKGGHLLEVDSWKEKFSLEINTEHTIKDSVHLNFQKYKILGFPFFNSDDVKTHQFETYFKQFIASI